MNILLTCAGRRTSLLRAFQEAAHSFGGRVLAADNNPLAPALYLADEAIAVPKVLDVNYIPRLLEIVSEKKIRLLVPTIDTELPGLAEHRAEFEALGCIVLISSKRFVDITGDKWLTGGEYSRAGIDTPRSWLPGQYQLSELPEKLFIKPRAGSASEHAYPLDRSRLDDTISMVPNAIIQERLRGQEITIDAFFDLEGMPIHCVPRRRIRTVGGESIEGVTIADEGLRPWLLRLFEVTSKLGARGALTFQAFLTERGPVLTEINPRFGGGFPLTNAAGGRYPEWFVASLRGERKAPCFGEYRRDLYMTRYYLEHFTQEPLWAK